MLQFDNAVLESRYLIPLTAAVHTVQQYHTRIQYCKKEFEAFQMFIRKDVIISHRHPTTGKRKRSIYHRLSTLYNRFQEAPSKKLHYSSPASVAQKRERHDIEHQNSNLLCFQFHFSLFVFTLHNKRNETSLSLLHQCSRCSPVSSPRSLLHHLSEWFLRSPLLNRRNAQDRRPHPQDPQDPQDPQPNNQFPPSNRNCICRPPLMAPRLAILT